MIKHNKLKTIVFSFGLAAMMLPATNLHAQDYDGSRGLFGLGKSSADYEYSGNRDVETSFTVNTQDFGQDTPLGSGVVILIGAGLGYVALKKKEDEQ